MDYAELTRMIEATDAAYKAAFESGNWAAAAAAVEARNSAIVIAGHPVVSGNVPSNPVQYLQDYRTPVAPPPLVPLGIGKYETDQDRYNEVTKDFDPKQGSLYGLNIKTAAGRQAEAALRQRDAAITAARIYANRGDIAAAEQALSSAKMYKDPEYARSADRMSGYITIPTTFGGKNNREAFNTAMTNMTTSIGPIVERIDKLKNPEPGKQIWTGPKTTTVAKTSSDAFSPSTYSAPAPALSLTPAKDVVNFQTQPASADALEQILFQQIGGHELVEMSRRDTIDGQSSAYTLISNLSTVTRELNPALIIGAQSPFRFDAERYQVNLDDKIPNTEYLTSNNLTSFFYIDTNGDLVIHLDNLEKDEEIEIEMANSGKIT